MKNKANHFGEKFKNFCTGTLKLKGILLILAILLVIAAVIGFGSKIGSSTQTVKLRLENIGELATQSAYCTEVNVTEDTKTMFGVSIPFTQSKYIYSYNIEVNAGIDFEKIKLKKKDHTIQVTLPEAKILSSELDMDSFKIYHEDEKLFNQIDLTENNQALKEMKKSAEETSIKNGLLDAATENAKVLIQNFLESTYDPEKYEIKFKTAPSKTTSK